MWDKMETPTIVYDLDTSGGLMQQIQALLAPPKSEDGEKRSRKPDKNARRSGRATNHDTCDSCREGGDLLCCDHCPAAFHLQCCNPPLSKEMLPPGDWMCHRCTVRRKKRELKKEQINGLVSKQSPSHAAEVEMTPGTIRLDPHATVSTGLRAAVAQVRLMERRPTSRPNTPTSTASTDTPTPSEQNDMDEDMLDVEDEAQCSDPESSTPHLKRPFDLLIAAAMERNPTQFQLPNELTCTTALPGTSKKRRRDEMTGKNVKRPQHELDHNGLVPLPVRVCYTCGRSCRLAPLIQCDYCPLLFHMDCLDPPLTAMPVGKWMCPNHIEHAVLKQRSLTLSSRCQLFDQFQDRMSQHAVKVDFLQRVHRLHPPLPRGSYTQQKKTLKVPDAIKCQYKCPPVMIPPAGIRYGELICSSIPEPSPAWNQQACRHLTSEEEQQEWLQDVISLQCSIMKHLSDRKTPSSKWEPPLTDQADVKPSVTTQDSAMCSANRKEASALEVPSVSCSDHQSSSSLECCLCKNTQCHCGPRNGPLSQHTRTKSSEEQGKMRSTEDPSGLPCVQTLAFSAPILNHVVVVKTEGASSKTLAAMASQIKSELAIPQAAHSTSPNAGSQGHDLAPTSSGLIPPNTFPQVSLSSSVLTEEKAGGSGVTSSSSLQLPSVPPSTMEDMASCLKTLADCNGEIQLSNLDETFIKLLAWQRVQQLLGSKAPSPQSSSSSNALIPGQGPLAQAAQSKEIQARAVFYPLNGKVSVNMCYRSLNIGTGADMDVCLTNYGHCNYVSGKHACIFYDENTKQYELLNYSEHGTTVDNVLYSCDFSAKTGPSPAGNLVSKVQNIIKRCKKKKREEEDPGDTAVPQEGVMSQSRAPASMPCDCKASSSSLIGGSGAGWEGTALLHHGSFVKLGCMQFVFSITEFATKQLKEESQPTSTSTPSASTAALQVEEVPEPSEKHSPQLYKVPVLQPSLVPQSGSPSFPY